MPLLTVTMIVGVVVLSGILLTSAICLDWSNITDTIQEIDTRFLSIAPYLAIAGLFFVFKKFFQPTSEELSKDIGIHLTDWIYAVEGLFVASLQGVTPDFMIPVFSAFYMFGFSFLLITPIALYLLTPAIRPLKELLLAYVFNYAAGTFFYTFFVALGPRNYVSNHVDGLMYQIYPQTQDLTSAVASNTDIFPSLHTSLAIIVVLFAWRTSSIQPRWFTISSIVATGVVLSTMVLGIHWAIDVLAGILLAVGCYLGSIKVVTLVEKESWELASPEDRGSETT
jgi:membrane-associated phospholipid phosphatase